MNTQRPRISIVILNRNQKKETIHCLESLKKINYPNYKILLIDNNSTDDSIDAVKKKFPDIKILENKKNLGCAGGRNLGIDYFLNNTKAEYLFFLDNDAIVSENILEELVKVSNSDEKIGIVGMKVYYLNEPDKFWIAGGAKIDWLKGKFYNSGQGEEDKGQFDDGKEIDSVPGGFTFVKRKVLEKVGRLDERYFIYYEDTDWCIRAKRADFKIGFAPGAVVWHNCSSSLGMESANFYYYRTRNRLWFMWNNAGRLKFMGFLCYFFVDFCYNILLTLYLNKKYPQLKAALEGVRDFFLCRFGERRK